MNMVFQTQCQFVLVIENNLAIDRSTIFSFIFTEAYTELIVYSFRIGAHIVYHISGLVINLTFSFRSYLKKNLYNIKIFLKFIYISLYLKLQSKSCKYTKQYVKLLAMQQILNN